MRRIERRLFAINDEIAALRRGAKLVEEELTFHKHLNDDAQRDAIISGNPLDRTNARETARDVRSFERNLAHMRRRLVVLESRRSRLVKKL